MTSPAPRPETIERLSSAVYPSFAMLAGMQLDLFTPLKDGPLSTAQVAAALGVRADKLQPLLYALVAAGLLTVEGERFANTPEAAHFLVGGRPTYLGVMHQFILHDWTAALKTAETVSSGSPAGKIDYNAMSEEEADWYRRGQHPGAVAAGRGLAARYDFSSYHTLVDVGGGTGGLCLAITEACPGIQATIVELPGVTPITRRFVAEAGASARIQVLEADVVNSPLAGSFDVAIMRNFPHVLGPGSAGQVFKNLAQAIKPGGAAYVLAGVLDDSRLSPPELVCRNLRMVGVFDGGQFYTEREYRDWLTEAGFEGFERVVLPDKTSIVTARKPGRRSR